MNSPLNTVLNLILLHLCITSHIRSSTISLASSRNWRDSMCLEFITALVNTAFERRIYLAPSKFRTVPGTHLHKTITHFLYESLKLLSRAIWAINDCLIPIDNRGRHGSILPAIRWNRCIIVSTQKIFLAYSIEACFTRLRSVCFIL